MKSLINAVEVQAKDPFNPFALNMAIDTVSRNRFLEYAIR